MYYSAWRKQFWPRVPGFFFFTLRVSQYPFSAPRSHMSPVMVLVYSLSYQKLVVPVFVVNCSRIVFYQNIALGSNIPFFFELFQA